MERAPASLDTQAEGREPQPSEHTARRTNKLDDKSYVQRVNGWFKAAEKKEKDHRDEEQEDHGFVSGHQWKDEHKRVFEQEQRPVLTLNFVLPIVNAVCGEERLNRQEIKVYGRSPEDDGGAHVMSELIRWVIDECSGDYAISRAFRHAVAGGRGWLGVKMNFLDDPLGKIDVEHVKYSEMYVDPVSEKADISDARYIIREKWLTEDEIYATWPDKADKIKSYKEAISPEGVGMSTEITRRGDAYKSEGDVEVYRAKDGTWRVWEVWHCEIQPGAIAVNPETGAIEELTKQELETIQKQKQQAQAKVAELTQGLQQAQALGIPPRPEGMAQLQAAQQEAQPLQHVERPIKLFYQGYVCGDVVLDRAKAPIRRLKRFPYVPIFGLWDDEDECWFGIVRPIKDAQRQHNVEQSAILHWTQVSPKTGWVGPKGSFVDRRRWETMSSKPGFIGEYNPSRGKPEQVRPAAIPRHIVELAGTRLQSMRDISGVNVDLLGSGVKETPGVVMELRRKQAMTVLQTLFDNLRLARRVLGEVLIAYIQEYVADDRKVRIVGQMGAQWVPATSDLQFSTFDAVVEDSPDTPTDKMATMHILQTTLPMLVKSGLPVPPSIVDTLPIAPHIKQEWKMMLQQMMGMGGGAPGEGPPPQGGPGAPAPQPQGQGGQPQPQGGPQDGPPPQQGPPPSQ